MKHESIPDREQRGAAAGPKHKTRTNELYLADVLEPIKKDWRVVAACMALAWLVALASILLPDRRYDASMVLAAVPSVRATALPAGLSSLLAGGQIGGIQATPYFIVRMLNLPSVLRGVAMSSSSGNPGTLVIERVMDEPLGKIRPRDVEQRLKEMLSTEVDKQTGLITVSAVHEDSALAREVATKMVGAASEAYVRAVRAQATEQRAAQEARVDSAAKLLRASEERLLAFTSSNREFTPYSATSIQRQRLERELSNAQAVYTQAVTDREQAIARELEETPAVVIVDALPSVLMPVPRQGVLKMAIGTMLGVIAAAILVLVRARGTFSSGRPAAPEPSRMEYANEYG